MSELFYSIVSERYDTEDGPHDCQILRLFKDIGHYQTWKLNPESTRPIDTVECLGGRVCPETQSYLEWASLDSDEMWQRHAEKQDMMAKFDTLIENLKSA